MSSPASTPEDPVTTVLLVEDDDAVRALTEEYLVRSGYRVLGAAHPYDGLHIAEEHPGPIALLLTDLVMPGMSGFELSHQVVKAHPESRVLYLSGYADPPRGLGLRHLLRKPFTADALVRKVREVLATARH